MVIEIRQSYSFTECSTCKRIIPQGSPYLYTCGAFGRAYYYCKYCANGKYGHTLSDFECFRPESDVLDFDGTKYDSWDNLKLEMRLIA